MECRKQASSNREAQASFLSLSHLPCDGTLPAGVEGPGGQHVQVVRVRSCLETLPSCCDRSRVCQGKSRGCWDAQGVTLCELQQPSQTPAQHYQAPTPDCSAAWSGNCPALMRRGSCQKWWCRQPPVLPRYVQAWRRAPAAPPTTRPLIKGGFPRPPPPPPPQTCPLNLGEIWRLLEITLDVWACAAVRDYPLPSSIHVCPAQLFWRPWVEQQGTHKPVQPTPAHM
jgi:hypothetical protein